MNASLKPTVVAVAILILPAVAAAQPRQTAQPPAGAAQSGDVVRRADDAFGVRVGVERFGLYSESFARGFSLEAAGNYRIDGAFFVPAATPINPLIEAATIRVGLNAVPFDFPAPSGVVDYTLRGPAAASFATARLGLDRYESPFVELDFSIGDPAIGLAGGFQAYPDSTYADGGKGDFFSVGLLPQWRPREGTQVRGLIGASRLRYDGDQGFATDGPGLPPVVAWLKRLGPSDARFEQHTLNAGLTGEHDFGGLVARASVFASSRKLEDADFTIISGLDARGVGNATLFTAPRQTRETLSAELALVRRFEAWGWAHQTTVLVRARQTDVEIPQGRAIDFGVIDIAGPSLAAGAIDRSSTGILTVDSVDQQAIGISHRAALGDGFEVRAGAQRMAYDKSVRRTGQADTSTSEDVWLSNASLVWLASPKLTVYAAFARGLEESGTAPTSAVNRNEVLPPVIARQVDAGLRYQLFPTVSISASVFEIAKPVPALDTARVFRLAGDAVYRGLEGSMNARLASGLSVVAGLVLLDMQRDPGSGAASLEPVGIAAQQASIGLSYTPPDLQSLGLDAQITLQGDRWADTANTYRTKGFVGVDLGARWRFGESGPTLRVQVVNATGLRQWAATPNQLLSFIVPRTWRLTLSRTF